MSLAAMLDDLDCAGDRGQISAQGLGGRRASAQGMIAAQVGR